MLALRNVVLALLVVAAWLPGLAHAQLFTYQATPVLSPVGTSWASESLGNPSVVYDSTHDRFIMVFEARTPLTHASCPNGIWALGIAFSPDGFTWTIETTPLLLPTPASGNYYSCVAAQPAVLFEDVNNGRIQVYFKGEETVASCAGSAFVTCPYTGIGRIRVTFNAAGDINGIQTQAAPVRNLDTAGGHPSVIKDGANYILAVQDYPDVYLAPSLTVDSFPTGTLILDPDNVTVDWGYDEFFSPSLVCDDGVAFPWAMWVGSKDTNFGALVDAAWGKGISPNGTTWALSATAEEEWQDELQFRGFDVLRLITGDYIMWYSEKDGSGNSEIYIGGTTLSFNNADVQGKTCP